MKTYLNIPTLLAAIFFMIAMVGCTDTQDAKTAPPAASTPVKKVKPLKIEGGEEILIAKDVTNVKPSWCDNNTLVFNKRHKGIFFYNKQEKKPSISQTMAMCRLPALQMASGLFT